MRGGGAFAFEVAFELSFRGAILLRPLHVGVADLGRLLQRPGRVREMRPGDRVFIYHSGGASSIVGFATVKSAPRDDPKNAKSAVVDLEYGGRVEPPVTLAEIKTSKKFDDWALVRQGRLSTMAAPEKFVAWMRERYPKAKL